MELTQHIFFDDMWREDGKQKGYEERLNDDDGVGRCPQIAHPLKSQRCYLLVLLSIFVAAFGANPYDRALLDSLANTHTHTAHQHTIDKLSKIKRHLYIVKQFLYNPSDSYAAFVHEKWRRRWRRKHKFIFTIHIFLECHNFPFTDRL